MKEEMPYGKKRNRTPVFDHYFPLFVPSDRGRSYFRSDTKSRVQWGGFTLRWYQEVFKSRTIMNAFYTTITITLVASIVATLLGTLAAIGIHSMKRRQKALMLGATNIPLLNADIVTGISLMLLLIKFTRLGMNTVLIAHITFNIPMSF